MEPLGPTREAMDSLDPGGDLALLDRLQTKAGGVRRLVPDCVGLSVTLVSEDLTFTFVATGYDVATLDAVQYVDGGPCANVANDPQVREFTSRELSERDWQLFADATSAAGVASTLTIPLRDGAGRVTGSLNFYGASAHCFDGHHDALAGLFAGWAPGAVTNADMSFGTSERAVGAPDRIRAQMQIDIAVGIIAARSGMTTDEASEALHSAAVRAGVDAADLAETVVRTRRGKRT